MLKAKLKSMGPEFNQHRIKKQNLVITAIHSMSANQFELMIYNISQMTLFFILSGDININFFKTVITGI